MDFFHIFDKTYFITFPVRMEIVIFYTYGNLWKIELLFLK